MKSSEAILHETMLTFSNICWIQTVPSPLCREKGVLLNAFRSIDAGKLGTVSTGGFAKAWGLLGVVVSSEEAQGLFLKYGHDKQGRMPYEVRPPSSDSASVRHWRACRSKSCKFCPTITGQS